MSYEETEETEDNEDQKDENFMLLLIDKRQKQLIEMLTQAMSDKGAAEQEIATALGRTTQAISSFVRGLSAIKIEAPQVPAANVKVELESVASAISDAVKIISDKQEITNGLLQKIIDGRISQWNFEAMEYDGNGVVRKVVAVGHKTGDA